MWNSLKAVARSVSVPVPWDHSETMTLPSPEAWLLWAFLKDLKQSSEEERGHPVSPRFGLKSGVSWAVGPRATDHGPYGPSYCTCDAGMLNGVF